MITPARSNPLADIPIGDFEPSTEPVKSPSYGNATTEGLYTPPKWEPARPSATDALQLQSRGVRC
jgi:hypothetical protein